MQKFDVVVIGTGAGTKLVRPIADLGFKVAVIEKGALGGTCLNRGCIPSKMLIHSADVMSEIKEAEKFEIDVEGPIHVRFQELINRVSSTVDQDSASIKPVYDKHPNITLFQEQASFVDTHTIQAGNHVIQADKFFIATGTRPLIPSIPGLDQTPFMTSNEALRLSSLPKRLLVIGGGFVALELGYFYASLGTQVTFIVRDKLLKNEDQDVVVTFEKLFAQKHQLALGHTPLFVGHENGIFDVMTQDKSKKRHVFQAESLLVATGVRPNTDDLQLDKAGIESNEKGYIKVNSFLQTSAPHIWALGDVIGRYFFRHSANFEAEYLMKSCYVEQTPFEIKYPFMPYAVFTNPQVARLGYTQQELERDKKPFVVGLNLYQSSAMGMALRSQDEFAKVLIDPVTRKLWGAHIVGKEAATMMHMFIAFEKMGATLDEMLDTIYIHPAMPEILRNALRKAKAQLP